MNAVAAPATLARLNPDQLATTSDADLQAYIAECSRQMLEADARYRAEGFIADKGLRDGLWTAEQQGLHERAKRTHLVRLA